MHRRPTAFASGMLAMLLAITAAAGGPVRLSAIFDWFREDFVRDAGSLGAFAARSAPSEAVARILVERGDRIEFLDYDWTLNAAPGQRP